VKQRTGIIIFEKRKDIYKKRERRKNQYKTTQSTSLYLFYSYQSDVVRHCGGVFLSSRSGEGEKCRKERKGERERRGQEAKKEKSKTRLNAAGGNPPRRAIILLLLFQSKGLGHFIKVCCDATTKNRPFPVWCELIMMTLIISSFSSLFSYVPFTTHRTLATLSPFLPRMHMPASIPSHPIDGCVGKWMLSP